LINEIDTPDSVLGRLSDLKYGDKARAIEIAEANHDFRRAIKHIDNPRSIVRARRHKITANINE